MAKTQSVPALCFKYFSQIIQEVQYSSTENLLQRQRKGILQVFGALYQNCFTSSLWASENLDLIAL